MAPIFVGIFLALIGAFLTEAEVRACAYERNNIGPVLFLVGVAIIIVSASAALSKIIF
ncbi:hypothetical protein [Pseudophaeobacter flagellatus]|uniref:hypothetical protein n=1 Tax=Pseudophaeobacter flagellatus TaxID=2899119 RepID=UPI001E2FF072|nr:hypothetical protein [Pseudophaeobacter flagellatus]MCD9148943.1 hypothetical protein [Pseudophaeobacter flagellatus]